METTEEIPFETIEQPDATLKSGTTVVETEGEVGQKKITALYKTIKGVREASPVSRTEEIVKAPVTKVVKVGTKMLNRQPLKEAIDLAKSKNQADYVESTFANLTTALTAGEGEYAKEDTTQTALDAETATLQDKIATLEFKAPEYTAVAIKKDELKKQVTLNYTLSNPLNNYISGKVNVYKDGHLLASKALDKQSVVFDGLDYDRTYIFKPELTYHNNLAEVTKEQETSAATARVELRLKKLELKEVSAVELYRRDDNGARFTKLSDLAALPTSLGNYYAKVKSTTFKDVLLPISKVEEITKDGKQFFQFTATIPELVQGENVTDYAEGYRFLVDKFVPAQNNVYYSIKELVEAMNQNKAGTYILGNHMDLSLLTPRANQIAYVTGEFTGKLTGKNGDKQFAFYGSTVPLFETLKNATVEHVVLKDVNINGGQDIGAIAKTADNAKITNVAVQGNITATRNIGGIISSARNSTRLEQVDFSGTITSPANTGGGSKIGGLVGVLDDSYIHKGHAKIDIHLNQANNNSYSTGGLVAQVTRSRWLNTVHVKDSYVEGKITNTGGGRVAGIVSSNWTNGVIENVLSDVKVSGGNIVYADAGALETNHRNVMKNFFVTQNATGEQTARFIPTVLTDEEAAAKRASFGLQNIASTVSDKLARTNEYKVDYTRLTDYNSAKDRAYKNIAKLIPLYNKEQVIKYGNKVGDNSKLDTTDILSVVPMKDNRFVNNYNDEINRLLVHYKDGTKEYYQLTNKQSDRQTGLDEYSLGDLGVIYTPNQFIQDYSPIVSVVSGALKAIDLYADSVAEVLGIGADTAKGEKLKKLYYDEQFQDTKENIETYLTNILTSSSVLRTDNALTNEAVIHYIQENKAALLLGITYMNRLYNINFGDVNIRDIMTNKLSEFYGKTDNPLEFLVRLGHSGYSTLLISSNVGTYSSKIAPVTEKKTLIDFLDYNRELFTDMDKYTWFRDTTKNHLYIAERPSEVPEIANADYKAYDKLQKAEFINYILPLLTMQKSNLYIISNYSTLVFGSKDRRPNDTQENWLRAINESADNFRHYIDNWYRIANENVKQRLVKERNLPIWDGYNAGGWADQYGRYGQANEFKSLREFFGPIGKWFGNNGLGAYALIGTRTPLIHFIAGDVLTDYGQSIFTHEVTHVYDDSIYLGGYGRRTGMGPEAYAQGLLQIPRNGGELGVNLMFTYPNDGTRWYNPRSDVFKTQADIDRYMKRYIDTLMVLDHAEADGVIATGNQTFMNGYYKKVDKQVKANGLDQFDLLRELNDAEKSITIRSIDDLVNNNFMTKFQLGNGTYDGNGIKGDAYVTPHMMLAIYGGNTSTQGAGAVMFKHNAFHLWGYYGYSNGFVGYTSTKYAAEAKAAGQVLGDKYVIQKISNGQFETLEQWKVAYYKEVKQKAETYFRPVTVNGKTISSYDQLKQEFQTIATNNLGNPSRAITQIINLKTVIYKAWLKDTDGFQEDIVGRP
ncbi:Zinc metalloprotease zmpB precursor [Streptococcus oralis]|uniref:Zinc metalloprotease zmpB n=1 Tax=Streptococcus oralis TaxID=1303 RepID=A0A139QPL7_STROR|nr:Zinc metalloprotease zmpB precursor [Streptococcus oralis]